MKAEYRRSMRFASGKVGGFIHTKLRQGRKVVIRKYVKQELGENNHHFGSIKKNIAAIWRQCSEPFKNDLKLYTERRKDFCSGDEIPVHTNYAYFIKFLYNCQKEQPEIDLATATKEELENTGVPTNVRGIIEQRLLPPIDDTESLTNDW